MKLKDAFYGNWPPSTVASSFSGISPAPDPGLLILEQVTYGPGTQQAGLRLTNPQARASSLTSYIDETDQISAADLAAHLKRHAGKTLEEIGETEVEGPE